MGKAGERPGAWDWVTVNRLFMQALVHHNTTAAGIRRRKGGKMEAIKSYKGFNRIEEDGSHEQQK